jgi:hypothetical protein
MFELPVSCPNLYNRFESIRYKNRLVVLRIRRLTNEAIQLVENKNRRNRKRRVDSETIVLAGVIIPEVAALTPEVRRK